MAFDVTLALVVLAFYETSMGKGGAAGLVDRGSFPVILVQVIHGAAAVFLAPRRRAPFLSGLCVAGLTLLSPSVAAPVSAYAVGAYVTGRRRAWVLIAALAVGFAQPWDYPDALEIAGLASMVLAPAVLGMYVGARHRHARALAEQARSEQEALAERARLQERARIAGEMHDVVTHRVSLMVLQAGALRASAPDEAVRRAAEDLRLIGCQTLEELRDLVGVLRSQEQIGTALAAQPAVLDVSELVAESRSAGIEVELHTDGKAEAVSPVIVRAAYRVVQEALTNVHKHAPGARVDVDVRYPHDRVRVTVLNTAPTREAEIALDGAGTGLTGLRKRLELVGGTLLAGPHSDGGFQVAADLPAFPTSTGSAL
ncbi:MAG TPA: histidine kinase [Catenuloplanes sp.]|jgi:signal transduction histidine kinase